ncbi:MAG: hypothetical protein ACRDMV_13225 [Streptosporangiales bacterium]
MVRLTHPKLPGREIEVPESGVAHRERAGWRRVRPSTHAKAEPKVTAEPKHDKHEGDAS